MPSLGADMEQGVLIEWLVKVGDPVRRGDIVAVVETPKSTVEVECFETGTIQQLLVEEGQTVPVGEALAILGADAGVPVAPSVAPASVPVAEPAEVSVAERVGLSVAEPAGVSVAERAAVPAAAGAGPWDGAEPAARRPLSPVLRHLARELGVDATTLHGTGRNGALTRHDVEHAAAALSSATVDTPVGAPPTPLPLPRPMPPPTPAPATTPSPVTMAPPVTMAGPATAREAPETRHRLRVSPLARRLAAEEGVDLTLVTGTGAEGTVRADDVRRAGRHTASSSASAQSPARPVSPVEVKAPATSVSPSPPPMSDMRRSIAALMTVSNQQIPHYHLTCTVDLWRSLQWMKERNRELEMSERLVPAALLLTATARAARAVPELNGHWIDGAFRPAADVDLGLILSLRSGGLLVPAIAGADGLSVEEMMARIKVLTRRARAGRLRGSDLVPPSITVSNLGDQGVDSVLGVIYPPQVALVGFGAVAERPWAVDGLLGVRPLVTVTLAGDHRATDGATGSRLLKTIDRLLQTPEEL